MTSTGRWTRSSARSGWIPQHFFAQLKLSELFYRLRALVRAEQETLKAIELAGNSWELSLARKQLQEIRRLSREGTQKPEWTKPLTFPAILLAMGAVALCLLVNFKMTKKWSFFAAAAVMAGYALISHGAPPLAVAIGIAFGAFMTSRATHLV